MKKLLPKLFFILACLAMFLLSGCSLLKDRTVDKVKIREIEKSTRLSPGAQIAYFPPSLSYPQKEPRRPYLKKSQKTLKRTPVNKDTLIKGENGSEMWVFFNPDGSYKGSICNCPQIKELTESDKHIREKQVESKANIELVDSVGKWAAIIIIPGQFFFALAWWLRKKPI